MFRGAVVTLMLLAGVAEAARGGSALSWVACANAQATASDADAKRRLAYGRHLATECTSCHRADTGGDAIPTLAGRPEAEIVALLNDFRDGRKTNAVMVSVASSLDAEATAAVAAYFASLPPPDPAPDRH